MVKYSDLTKDDRSKVKSILNGNGLKTKDIKIYKDGQQTVFEVISTGQIIKVD